MAFLTVWPALYLVFSSFNKVTIPGSMEFEFTLDHYFDIFRIQGQSERFTKSLVNTTTYTVLKTLLSLLIGGSLAWLVARTNIQFKRFIMFSVLVPNLLPGTMTAMGWVFLLSPRSGLVNEVAKNWLGAPVFDVYTIWGVISLGVLWTFPLDFLILYPAFKSMNPELEESSRMMGDSTVGTLRRITLPMMTPAILTVVLLGLVRGIEVMTPVLFVGVPGDVTVIAYDIYDMVARTYPPNYAYGFVLSTIILSFSIILIILYRRATKLTSKYVTVTGKAPRPKTIDLGRWKYVVTVIVLVFLAFMSYSPAVLAVIESLTPFASAYGPETLTRLTLKNYATVISDARFAGIVSNTVFMAIIAAVACLLLALVVGYLAVRTKGKSGAVLHVASTFPLALPGAVIGTSLLWTFATTPIYGTMWILIFGLIIKNLPFGIALSVQGMYQVGYELEECSRMCGASWVGTFRRIMVPLLRASIFSSLFYLLIRSLGELEVVLLLRGTESEVLSTWLYTEWATGSARLASAMAVIIMIVNVALYLATRGAEHRGKGATAEAMKP